MSQSKILVLFLLLSLPVLPVFHRYDRFSDVSGSHAILSRGFLDQDLPRTVWPVYLRLQVLEKTNFTLWESVPQNFSDHVATIDSRVLAMFVSSNSIGFNLTRDSLGNLWMVTNYSLNAGDYVTTLAYVSSGVVGSENLTSLGSVAFPNNYPDYVRPFLNPGRKILSENQTIVDIAVANNQTQNNMTQTAKNVIDFVKRQSYDQNKTTLLMSGNLVTSDLLDFLEDALQVHETNSSICVERSWYAAAILRAAGIPTRTVTEVTLKTWIQVWLPNLEWVDAETLCRAETPPHVSMFPKSIFGNIPWVVENSSDAMMPFTWLPKVPVRIANLPSGNMPLFQLGEFNTVLSQPIEADVFKTDPTNFRFRVRFEPDAVYAAVTRQGSDLYFSLINEDENASKPIVVDEPNSVSLGDLMVSFIPAQENGFLVLYNFSVGEVSRFDVRLLLPIVGVPVAVVAVLLYWRRRK